MKKLEVIKMFASRIANLREGHDLNQKELADKLGINRSVLNRIEKGTRPIRDDELNLIANYFNVSTDYLLGRDVNSKESLSEEQKNLLKAFESLKAEAKQAVWTMINSLRVTHSAGV